MYQTQTASQFSKANSTESALLKSVFLWMSVGLFLTAGVSGLVLNSDAFLNGLLTGPRLLLLTFIELALVFVVSANIYRIGAVTATVLFLLYSVLNGVTLAPLAFIYTAQSFSSAFFIAGLLFGSMACYGSVTNRDISGMGNFLLMALWGIILAGVVNLYFLNDAVTFAISVLGVVVFTGLTAHDVQKIKAIEQEALPNKRQNVAILGALTLYLDFLNLFLSVLQLRKRKE